VALSKFARGLGADPGMDPASYAELPAHHRYPVWWTGDQVSLQASVETMVDSGLHGFKPFVHSDCGGDWKGSEGSLLRWTAHCAFGSILRFHGADHRPWKYSGPTLDRIRAYLQVRYRLLPSLIAAGRKATETGRPLVARSDLFWPDEWGSSINTQYIFLEDLLVAPMFHLTAPLETTIPGEIAREVWVPPGDWEDAWDGSIVRGPVTLVVQQPSDRIPLWYRRDGAFIVLACDEATRVDDQDWSTLTLEVFPSAVASETRRFVAERGSSAEAAAGEARTELVLRTDGQGGVAVDIGDGPVRAWIVRLHLLPGQLAAGASLDGAALEPLESWLCHLGPGADTDTYFPLLGAGTAPASQAGPVAELRLPVVTLTWAGR